MYALNDPALGLQADAVQTNFKLWIVQNFLLSPAQATVLTGIDDPLHVTSRNSVPFAFSTGSKLT
ncbi:hypothetical protein ACFX5U_08630 [Sphingobacterium sp. SG20118]|uniref:hypothetical protein n=1 Tax=Sphingobacterium sp. SG20118 TaxID=3367156 RepID=UPI0037DFC7A5